MPEAIAAPPSPRIAPSAAPPAQPGAAPPSGGVVHLDKPIDPTPPPKPGTARAAVFDGLRKRAGLQASEPPPEKPPAKETPTPPKPTEQKPDETPTPEKPAVEGDKPIEPSKPTEPEAKGKASPWKLVDQFKQRALEAETKLAEMQKLFPDAKAAESTKARYDQIEKRNGELESEIRYVSYTKSQEFQEKYAKPYEQAWQRAMSNLGEIPVDLGNGQARAMTAEDLVQLVNLPLTQAKELAEQKFGTFANEVMSERKEIKRLWEAQAQALDDAKKNAGEREKQLKEHWEKQTNGLREHVTKAWDEANKAIPEHPEFGQYFKAAEGDTEGKESLEKGFKLVDEAFSTNPFDPRLNDEQRSQAIRRQAVIRHRAAAFGNLTRKLKGASSRIAELEKELSQYKESTPAVDGQKPASTPPAVSTRESVMEAFRAKAR